MHGSEKHQGYLWRKSSMANPQVEDGYTPIANEILEALARTKLSPNESRILFFLIRKTYGWKKKTDWISLSQFSKGTWLDRRNAHKAVKRLSDKRMVVICRDDIKHPRYSFQKDYQKWRMSYVDMTNEGLTKLAEETVKERERREKKSVVSGTPIVYLPTPTKQTITKETIKKREERAAISSFSSSKEEDQQAPKKKVYFPNEALSTEERMQREERWLRNRDKLKAQAAELGVT
jgi:phage replication O-like protein O